MKVQAAAFAMLAGSVCALGQIDFKAPTNPTGIPDFTQDISLTRTGLCSAAAWANGMWYYQNTVKKTGLFPHTDPSKPEKDWEENARTAVNQLADQIYGTEDGKGEANGGPWGVQKYIYQKRKADMVKETKKDTKTGKEYDVNTWSWNVTAPGFNKDIKPEKVNAYLDALRTTDKYYGVHIVSWHEKDAAAGTRMDKWDDEGKPVKDSSGQAVKLTHELGFAGKDQKNGLLPVTNGWGNHAGNNPVDKTYYDQYSYKIEDGRIRVTDPKLLTKIGGLGNRTADYAEVVQLHRLESDAKRVLGAEMVKKLGVQQETVEFRLYYENMWDVPINQAVFELPLVSPGGILPGQIHPLSAPSGWSYDSWDPNADTRLQDVVGQQGDNAAIFNGYGFKGVQFSTGDNLLMPGESAFVVFDVDASLLRPDYADQPLAIGAWGTDDSWYTGVVIPAPGSSLLALTGLAAVARRRRA